MTLIQKTFAALQAKGRRALIPYVMAGDPAPWVTVGLMHRLVDAGANLIELGLPFSDPMADGKTIAYAAKRALDAGTSTQEAFAMCQEFRKTNSHTPVVVMGYLNPVEMMGQDAFVELCVRSGVSGVLLVDLPPQEAGALPSKLAARGIDMIFLLAPTTQPARMQQVLDKGQGFIYYVSLTGVTGASTLDATTASASISKVKTKTCLPVCAGFGIDSPNHARTMADTADGVIVGSALVRHFTQINAADEAQILAASDALINFFVSLRKAVDS